MGALRRVLIASSLTPASDEVVAVGLALARAAGAQAHVIHVASLPILLGEGGFGFGESTIEADLERLEREGAEDRLRQQVERLGGVDAATSVELGSPHREIARVAEEIVADLVVVGAAEEGRAFGRLLGSTSDRVLRTCRSPIWLVRGSAVPPTQVVAPVDLSPLSAQALARGVELLSAVDGAFRLTALFVLSPLQRVAPQFSAEQVDRFAAEELERFVSAAIGPRAASTVRTVRCGGPREEILSEVGEVAADLLILGTHGRGGLDRWVIGSVAADVAREATCSVLLMPSQTGG